MAVASSEDPFLIPDASAGIVRCNLTAVSSLLTQGVPFVPTDRQREPVDILIPRASVEAIRCNLTAAISRLAEGELSVPKDRQREPTDETATAADLDGREEAEEEERRKGRYDGKGSRKGRGRGKPRDINSRSRSRSRDRRLQSSDCPLSRLPLLLQLSQALQVRSQSALILRSKSCRARGRRRLHLLQPLQLQSLQQLQPLPLL